MDKNAILKMPLLDIISKWEKTEEIIKSYDDEAGTCICCNNLFDPLEKIVEQYSLPEKQIVEKILSVLI